MDSHILTKQHKTYRFSHDLDTIVFLITDPDQLPRIVVAYRITKQGIQYELVSGVEATYHMTSEIQGEADFSKFIIEDDDEPL